MNVIILAAGVGSRLRPLTDSLPKPLVKVRGIPLIEHQISNYINSGIKESEIYVVAGYKKEIIEKYLKDRYPNVNLIYNDEYKTTNNMYSLFLALNSIGDIDEDVIINNGDCIYELAVISGFVNAKRDLIACDSSDYLEESMKIIMEDKLTKISKQITKDDATAVSIDLYKFSPSTTYILKRIIEKYLEKDKNKWTEEAIQILLNQAYIMPYDIHGLKWVEVDNYEDLLHAEYLFSNFELHSKKVIILDLDGTVYVGNEPIIQAINFINKNWNRFKFYFMTNNSSKTKEDYVEKLSRMGVKNLTNENIITPIEPLITFLKSENIRNIFCIGTESFKLKLTKNGIQCNDIYSSDIEAVVVGYDTELTYDKLKNASLLLHDKNIKFYATHGDNVCPTEDGFIPDIGSILALLNITVKRSPEKIFGKPNLGILEEVLKEFKKEEVLIVGDRLYTDKKLADNADIDFVLVLSGETKLSDAQDEIKIPILTLNNLGDLR